MNLAGSGLVGWAAVHRQPPDELPPPEIVAERGRMAEIIDELSPLPGEVVIRKASPSVFWGTPLIGQLTAHHVDTILVAGESTSGCVRSTVVDGCTNRFNMIVVEECADIVSIDEVITYVGNVSKGNVHASS